MAASFTLAPLPTREVGVSACADRFGERCAQRRTFATDSSPPASVASVAAATAEAPVASTSPSLDPTVGSHLSDLRLESAKLARRVDDLEVERTAVSVERTAVSAQLAQARAVPSPEQDRDLIASLVQEKNGLFQTQHDLSQQMLSVSQKEILLLNKLDSGISPVPVPKFSTCPTCSRSHHLETELPILIHIFTYFVPPFIARHVTSRPERVLACLSSKTQCSQTASSIDTRFVQS